MSPRRVVSVIPAAGHSRRMGTPKLILPYGNGTVMDRVLKAWCESEVTRVIVVVRRQDEALARVCARWPVDIVAPQTDPVDMRASIQCGLQLLIDQDAGQETDGCMFAPADLPKLTSALINEVCASVDDGSQIVAPRFGDRQGHPVYLPWVVCKEVFRLPPDRGLDYLIEQRTVRWVRFPQEAHVADIDTPSEYQQLQQDDN